MSERKYTIENRRFGEERALYGLKDTLVRSCEIDGPEDGESAFKECRDISIEDVRFNLRYPVWHAKGFEIKNCSMSETTRAALWYCENGLITDSILHGIKALRECNDVEMRSTDVISDEFGWKSGNIRLYDVTLESSYLFFDSKDIKINNLKMKGKYSFQYVSDVVIENSYLDTKDAFWHGKNITVRNSTIKGEYLAWFSEGLTLENCTIIGTQPLCYCKDLKLINCRMENCDLAFEYSSVSADVIGKIDSVKNPKEGYIIADEIGEIIRTDDVVMECSGKVEIRK